MRLDWLVTGYHAPWFIGLEKGIFAKHGVDLTVGEGRGSSVTIQAVAAGTDTFGFADASVLPRAVPQGADAKMVCGYQQTTAFAVMSLASTGIRSPKDLEGRSYADAPGSATNALFPGFLKAAGVDASKVKVISITPSANMQGLLEKQFDATFTSVNDSFVKLKRQGHELAALAYADYGLSILAHGLITSNKTLTSAPDLVRGFIAGWLESVELTKQDPAAAAQASKSANPDAPDVPTQVEMLQDALNRLGTKNTVGKPAGWMSDQDWTSTVNSLTQYGVVKDKVEVANLFTNDFLPR